MCQKARKLKLQPSTTTISTNHKRAHQLKFRAVSDSLNSYRGQNFFCTGFLVDCRKKERKLDVLGLCVISGNRHLIQ